MTGGREHQGSSCRGVGVVRLEPFDPSSGSGRGLLAESSNAEDVRPKATARFDLAFFWIARWCVAFVPGAYPARSGSSVPPLEESRLRPPPRSSRSTNRTDDGPAPDLDLRTTSGVGNTGTVAVDPRG